MTSMSRELEAFEDNFDVRLPTHRIVCPECDGKGAVDCFEGGWSLHDDFVDDDFIEDYARGHYDKECPECHGRNVVDEVDRSATPTHFLKEWDDWMQSARETDAIYRMERAMGA